MAGLRFTTIPGTNNADAIISRENKTPAYASAIAVACTKEITKVFIALTGACSLTATNSKCYKGDELDVVLSADASARTVTLSTGFSGLTAATIVCAASKTAIISFIFDGTNWIEKSRAVAA